MRALLVLLLGFAMLPPVVNAQGASELGAPRSAGETGETPTPTTESVDPAVAPSPSAATPAAASAPEATPPSGAPAVPPGYETAPAHGQPAYGQPAYGQPAYGQPAYGQPAQPGYGAPAYVPPVGPIPRLTRMRLRDGMEIPPYARTYERRLGFLMWPGLGLFVGGYAISTILAADDAIAAVPLVGPLLWQAQHGTSQDLELTVPLTILQLVGVVAFSIGVKKRRYVEVWRVGDQPVPPPGRQIAVAPYADRHGGGISLMVF